MTRRGACVLGQVGTKAPRVFVASFLRVWRWPPVRVVVLTAYYLAVIAALVWIYGTSHYTPPPFIYQGF